jgi:hypothetical protein
MIPILDTHQGVVGGRDGLMPGGTMSRFISTLVDQADEVVYASSAEGGAQSALACVGRQLGKRVTIFGPARDELHPRQPEAQALGARLVRIPGAALSVLHARARQYCLQSGAALAPFGMHVPGCIEIIAHAARQIGLRPTQVWCAAGWGTLATALRVAWPEADHHAVQVGFKLTTADVAGATLHEYPMAYDWGAPPSATPFPSDPHYEAKAWQVCQARRAHTGVVVFWNVMGPPLAAASIPCPES